MNKTPRISPSPIVEAAKEYLNTLNSMITKEQLIYLLNGELTRFEQQKLTLIKVCIYTQNYITADQSFEIKINLPDEYTHEYLNNVLDMYRRHPTDICLVWVSVDGKYTTQPLMLRSTL